jgi:hypothetical protein
VDFIVSCLTRFYNIGRREQPNEWVYGIGPGSASAWPPPNLSASATIPGQKRGEKLEFALKPLLRVLF